MTISEAYILRLQELLKEKKMTQYRFVRESCIPMSTLQSIKYGKTKSPNMTLFFMTAYGLGISVIEFLDSPYFNMDDIEFL